MSESTPKPDGPQPSVPMSRLVEWANHFSTAIEALFAGRLSEAVRGFSEALWRDRQPPGCPRLGWLYCGGCGGRIGDMAGDK